MSHVTLLLSPGASISNMFPRICFIPLSSKEALLDVFDMTSWDLIHRKYLIPTCRIKWNFNVFLYSLGLSSPFCQFLLYKIFVFIYFYKSSFSIWDTFLSAGRISYPTFQLELRESFVVIFFSFSPSNGRYWEVKPHWFEGSMELPKQMRRLGFPCCSGRSGAGGGMGRGKLAPEPAQLVSELPF